MTLTYMTVDGITYTRTSDYTHRLPMLTLKLDCGLGPRSYWRHDPDRPHCERCWLRHGAVVRPVFCPHGGGS